MCLRENVLITVFLLLSLHPCALSDKCWEMALNWLLVDYHYCNTPFHFDRQKVAWTIHLSSSLICLVLAGVISLSANENTTIPNNSRLFNVFGVLLQLLWFVRYLIVWFDTKCDAKSGNSLSSKKKKQILASWNGSSIRNTPSLEVFVWYPVCTCYGIPVTVRLCSKLKPNVCLTLREVNCMLAIRSGVKDLRQACDMKCKSVFSF